MTRKFNGIPYSLLEEFPTKTAAQRCVKDFHAHGDRARLIVAKSEVGRRGKYLVYGLPGRKK
jgi:hypothetical protein